MIKSIVLFSLFNSLIALCALGQSIGIPLKTSQLSIISGGSMTNYSAIGEPIIAQSLGNEVILHQGFVQKFHNYEYSVHMIENNTLSIYPVPSFQNITIEGNVKLGYSHFVIIDNLGKSVRKGQLLKENLQTIDIQSLDSGIYFIRFISTENNQTKTLKFLKL